MNVLKLLVSVIFLPVFGFSSELGKPNSGTKSFQGCHQSWQQSCQKFAAQYGEDNLIPCNKNPSETTTDSTVTDCFNGIRDSIEFTAMGPLYLIEAVQNFSTQFIQSCKGETLELNTLRQEARQNLLRLEAEYFKELNKTQPAPVEGSWETLTCEELNQINTVCSSENTSDFCLETKIKQQKAQQLVQKSIYYQQLSVSKELNGKKVIFNDSQVNRAMLDFRVNQCKDFIRKYQPVTKIQNDYLKKIKDSSRKTGACTEAINEVLDWTQEAAVGAGNFMLDNRDHSNAARQNRSAARLKEQSCFTSAYLTKRNCEIAFDIATMIGPSAVAALKLNKTFQSVKAMITPSRSGSGIVLADAAASKTIDRYLTLTSDINVANALKRAHEMDGSFGSFTVPALRQKYKNILDELSKVGVTGDEAKQLASKCIRSGLCGDLPADLVTLNMAAEDYLKQIPSAYEEYETARKTGDVKDAAEILDKYIPYIWKDLDLSNDGKIPHSLRKYPKPKAGSASGSVSGSSVRSSASGSSVRSGSNIGSSAKSDFDIVREKPNLIQPDKVYDVPIAEGTNLAFRASKVQFQKNALKDLDKLDSITQGKLLDALVVGGTETQGKSGLKLMNDVSPGFVEVKAIPGKMRLLGCMKNGVLEIKKVFEKKENGQTLASRPELKKLCK